LLLMGAEDLSGSGLAGAVDRLAHEFGGVFALETVEACVADSHSRLGEARIAQYRPLLAYCFARERLRASARAAGLAPSDAPEVLFVCTRNAARSQLAAALLADRSGGRVAVRSAGTDPAPEVDPDVLAALAEIGVDAGKAFLKPLTDETVAAADVVTMGCGDACPVLPGRRYVDWDMPDPAGQGLGAVRDIHDVRDRIDGLVGRLLADLGAA
jgi:arsenate reductase